VSRAQTGITKRHAKACRSREGRRCNCTPTFQAQVWDGRAKRRHTRTFPSYEAARSWRHDVLVGVRTGAVIAPQRSIRSVTDALDALVDGMRDGRILDRSGKPYKPATIRSYEQAARNYLKPALGLFRLDELRRADVQALVEAMRGRGLHPSTIHNKLDPLRVVYRRAIRDDLVGRDPTAGLELPRVRGRRDRIAAPKDASRLLDALPDGERALWATAFYGGLRIGELRALRWRHVDFDAGVIRVERSWDDVEGEIDVKSDAGRRVVPLAGRLRHELAARKLRTGRGEGDLVFGRTPTQAFVRTTARRRALAAWTAFNEGVKQRARELGREVDPSQLLTPLTAHEARHTCASYLIAAGLNPKQVQTYIGHSDVRTTYNIYGHLLPGDEREAASRLDAFLDGNKSEGIRTRR
jgi:integrase